MKKIQPRRYIYCLLLALIVVGYVGTLVLWRHQRARINDLQQQVDTVSEQTALNAQTSYNPATISPSESAVYLPLAKLKLPATSLTEGLVYNYTDAYTIPGASDGKLYPATLSLSTHDLVTGQVRPTKQFDCTEVAYADFVTPSYAVNPMYKSDGNVSLADGRTMHVYYAPAIPGCDQSWKQSSVDSKAIADTLKKALSY